MVYGTYTMAHNTRSTILKARVWCMRDRGGIEKYAIIKASYMLSTHGLLDTTLMGSLRRLLRLRPRVLL